MIFIHGMRDEYMSVYKFYNNSILISLFLCDKYKILLHSVGHPSLLLFKLIRKFLSNIFQEICKKPIKESDVL